MSEDASIHRLMQAMNTDTPKAPHVIHLTVEDENWLRERREEQQGNKPHRRPAPPEDDREMEERGGHDKKAAAIVNIVARFERVCSSEAASLSRK